MTAPYNGTDLCHAGDTKVCPVCGREFSRPADATEKRWAAQLCCGTECGRRLGGTRTSIWTDDELARAQRMREFGMGWAETWQAVTGGAKSSPEGLRLAVKKAKRKRNPLRALATPMQSEEARDEGAAISALYRPTPRQAALLACEPESARRLMGWA
jgi:hypothetical protein